MIDWKRTTACLLAAGLVALSEPRSVQAAIFIAVQLILLGTWSERDR